jgi:PleD family two-component response regulator
MNHNRLLLIEDDPDVAEMLIMYFTSHRYEVFHADTGLAGIEMARVKFPNLILLDVMLPHMDGYDVCRHLRQTALTKYIPILFLTQRDERASKVKGLELGADDYITKPFDIDELRLRVQGSIRRANRENLHESRTGLPTGSLVEEEIQRLEVGVRGILGFTIEGFNTYNDIYGFVAANEVIAYAARAIQQVLAERGTHDDFVGILNDEFIVLTHSADVDGIAQAICDKFNNEVKAFYSFVDVDRGGVLLNEGTPEATVAPLMSLKYHKRNPVAA